MPDEVILSGYAAVVVGEMYFFVIQRLAHEFGKAKGLAPSEARAILPLWYAWVFPVTGLKWLVLVGILLQVGWGPALIALLVPFGIKVVLPIPYSHAFDVCERALARRGQRGEADAVRLSFTLQNYRKETER